MQKKSQLDFKKSQKKPSKIIDIFFFKSKFFLKFKKNLNIKKSIKKNWTKNVSEKNAIFLVLPIEEICLWPELSSPPRFRIQGGSPERQTLTDGRESSCLI